ncbi:glycosyltransferase family 2 protein, partial [Rahnella aceris]|nr:glycosyltransferase family 2 protein [Rahnella aceris]
GKDAVFSMLENEITGFLWHKIFRREVFQGVSFDSKLPVFEDYLVIMTLFIKGANISFGNEPKYHYIQHASSLTKKSYQKSLDRLLYLDMTKTLVKPLISTEVDKLRLIKHEYMVILMVFINEVKFGSPASEVAKIKDCINIHSLIKLKKQLNLKRFYAIFMIKVSPYLFYFMLKTAFKIKA